VEEGEAFFRELLKPRKLSEELLDSTWVDWKSQLGLIDSSHSPSREVCVLGGCHFCSGLSIYWGVKARRWGGMSGKWRAVQLESMQVSSILSFGDETETEKWDLVEGSVYGGQGFGPCSYPQGWNLNETKSSSTSYICIL